MNYLHFIVYIALLGFSHAKVNFRPYNETASTMFNAADVNFDGAISRSEIDTLFAAFDADKDGSVTRKEYADRITFGDPTLRDFANVLFEDYDMNNDHKLNRLDYDAYFAKVDVNGDGTVTEPEFITYWTKIFIDNEHHFASNAKVDFKPYNETASSMFSGADIDFDGNLTRAEITTLFAAFDANHDGNVTRKEYTDRVTFGDSSLLDFANVLFDDYDMNNDHTLNKLDFDAYFAKVDANGDHGVSESEFITYWTQIFILNEHQFVAGK